MTKRPRVKQAIYDEIMKEDGKSFNDCLLSFMTKHDLMAVEFNSIKYTCGKLIGKNVALSKENRLLKKGARITQVTYAIVLMVSVALWITLS